MLLLTDLPAFITTVVRGMPGAWTPHQRWLRCWRIVLQAVYPGRQTLAARPRWSPPGITAWRFRRVLNARDWWVHRRIAWLAEEVVAPWPPPEDGTIAAIGDGSPPNTRARQNPLAHTGRTSPHHPWLFGIRFALLIVAGDVDRMPVALRRILPKTPPASRPAQALFRAMRSAWPPPAWAPLVRVAGDATSGSPANIPLVKQRHRSDAARDWPCVFAIARPWNTVDDQAVKHLVPHLPGCRDQRTGIPRLATWRQRNASWFYAPRRWPLPGTSKSKAAAVPRMAIGYTGVVDRAALRVSIRDGPGCSKHNAVAVNPAGCSSNMTTESKWTISMGTAATRALRTCKRSMDIATM